MKFFVGFLMVVGILCFLAGPKIALAAIVAMLALLVFSIVVFNKNRRPSSDEVIKRAIAVQTHAQAQLHPLPQRPPVPEVPLPPVPETHLQGAAALGVPSEQDLLRKEVADLERMVGL